MLFCVLSLHFSSLCSLCVVFFYTACTFYVFLPGLVFCPNVRVRTNLVVVQVNANNATFHLVTSPSGHCCSLFFCHLGTLVGVVAYSIFQLGTIQTSFSRLICRRNGSKFIQFLRSRLGSLQQFVLRFQQVFLPCSRRADN